MGEKRERGHEVARQRRTETPYVNKGLVTRVISRVCFSFTITTMAGGQVRDYQLTPGQIQGLELSFHLHTSSPKGWLSTGELLGVRSWQRSQDSHWLHK